MTVDDLFGYLSNAPKDVDLYFTVETDESIETVSFNRLSIEYNQNEVSVTIRLEQ